MLTRTRRHVLFGLAALSVVGLLSMHGFDPVVATVDGTHLGHSMDNEASLNHHGVIGLCVFVAAVTSLGLAARRSRSSTRRPVHVFRATPVFAGTTPPTLSGPPLLHRLCVLRL